MVAISASAQAKSEDDGWVRVPLFLIRERTYFPAIVRKDDPNLVHAYLWLLRRQASQPSREVTIALSDLGAAAPGAEGRTSRSLANRAETFLKKLRRRYYLLDYEVKSADEARVILPKAVESGERGIDVPVHFWDSGAASRLSGSAVTVYLNILSVWHRHEGPITLDVQAMAESSFLSPRVLQEGIDELKRAGILSEHEGEPALHSPAAVP